MGGQEGAELGEGVGRAEWVEAEVCVLAVDRDDSVEHAVHDHSDSCDLSDPCELGPPPPSSQSHMASWLWAWRRGSSTEGPVPDPCPADTDMELALSQAE